MGAVWDAVAASLHIQDCSDVPGQYEKQACFQIRHARWEEKERKKEGRGGEGGKEEGLEAVLQLSKRVQSQGVTVYEVRFAGQILTIQSISTSGYNTVESSSPSSSPSSSSSSSLSTEWNYLWNGISYRQHYIHRSSPLLSYEDYAHFSSATWHAVQVWMQELLDGVGLGGGREGWIQFVDEVLPWEEVGRWMQGIRGLMDVGIVN